MICTVYIAHHLCTSDCGFMGFGNMNILYYVPNVILLIEKKIVFENKFHTILDDSDWELKLFSTENLYYVGVFNFIVT
jgi:hypothetical protein